MTCHHHETAPTGLSRRTFCALVPGTLAAVLLPGCMPDDTGPVEIRWDRDACTLCNMIISDKRFAAQVRGGPKRKATKFDDIGCALNWLALTPWKGEPDVEIWVNDYDKLNVWLEARKAFWVPGLISPMDYGFGAVAAARDNSVSFLETQKLVLAKGSPHCETPPS